ncbi:MAG: ABC transporter ATP-binding protein [Planctomycetes bacterium]|nr:ABC transporter ATP-binding protein [Planctomycetota bacterium]
MAGRALRTNLSEVTRRVRLFGNIVGWVLGDVYRNAKGQFVLIFALSVLGVIARLGVIAVLMTFVHAQTSGRPVVVGGFELPSDTGFWTLTLWGGLVLVFSVVTGLANYLAEVRNFRLAREAMNRAVDRTLAVVAAGQSRPLAVWANEGMKAMARKVVMGDAMMLARSVLLIGGFTVSVTTFVIAVVALFILNAQLTAILAPVFLIYAVPFYKLNRAVVNASRDYDDRRLERARVLGGLLNFASQTHYPGVTRPAWADLYQADPSVSGTMDAFRGIIMPRRRVAFLQDVFLGVVLLVLLVVFGSFLVSDELAWLPFVSYFVALRFAITGMGGTATMVTAVNRFVPQLHRLKEFASLDVEAAAVGIDEDAKLWTFHAVGPELEESAPSATPQPGDVVACIDPCPTDSYRLVEFCQRLLGTTNRTKCNRLLGAMFYCGDVRSFPGLSVVQLLTGEKEPDTSTVDEAKRVLERFGVLNEIEALPLGMETTLGPESTEGLSPLCLYALRLTPGVRSSRQYFVLDWKPLARMGSKATQAIFDVLSDRIVMLAFNRPAKDILSHASVVFLLDDHALCGITTPHWLASHKAEVSRRLQLVGVTNAQEEEQDVDQTADDL